MVNIEFEYIGIGSCSPATPSKFAPTAVNSHTSSGDTYMHRSTIPTAPFYCISILPALYISTNAALIKQHQICP